MPDLKIYKHEYKINSYDVDQNGNARFTSILNYMQNSAWLHYTAFENAKGTILPENYGWLLSRVRLKINTLPLWGDNIFVETWSPGVNRMFALRDFQIFDKNGLSIVSASTAWLIVDISKSFPVRPDFFKEKWDFIDNEAFFDITKKIKTCDSIDTKHKTKANYSDIDVNKHVNNAKYVEWMLDCYNSSFVNNNTPQNAEIDFTGQAVINDLVEIGLKQINGDTYFSNVFLKDRELCKMIITWKEN